MSVKSALAAAAVILALASSASAQDNPPTLSANGAGVEHAAPDMAVVTLGVLSRAATAREALDANNADMEKVIQSVRGQAIADKDISTTGFSISPVYSRPPQPRPGEQPAEPTIVAYQVSNQVRVVVRDIDKTGAVVDAAVSSGANQAGSINFDISDRQTLADKAIASAIADAKRKAEIMAEAAGVRLVRVLNVNANEGGGGPVFRLEARAASPAADVPVMGGELSVSANAQISWEIAPK
jgi:uncharacterized protein YggE